MLFRVLVAVRSPHYRSKLAQMLQDEDYVVMAPVLRGLSWESIIRESYDLILIHNSFLPEPPSESVQSLRSTPDNPAVVILTDTHDAEYAAEMLAAGIEAVLNSRLSPGEVLEVLRTILKKREEATLAPHIEPVVESRPQLSDFSSNSPSMQSFLYTVRRVVNNSSPLLILGETGTGKEWLARSIHAEGPRANGPFIAVNCGALPETLLESELFGHERGAFTGASHARRGRFELAHRGTIFLDEIGDMPYSLQVKLLRVLQDQEIQRLGSERTITVDARIVASTNRNLREDVEARQFREDLFYRLSVIELVVPPLRERREDIPEIAKSYVEYFRGRITGTIEGVSDAAMEALCNYAWPGNVRELINIIERAMILCEEEWIQPCHLPASISGVPARAPSLPASSPETDDRLSLPPNWSRLPLADVRKALCGDLERLYLATVLREENGRIGETARRTGIDPRSIHEKMKRHGLRKEDFRVK